MRRRSSSAIRKAGTPADPPGNRRILSRGGSPAPEHRPGAGGSFFQLGLSPRTDAGVRFLRSLPAAASPGRRRQDLSPDRPGRGSSHAQVRHHPFPGETDGARPHPGRPPGQGLLCGYDSPPSGERGHLQQRILSGRGRADRETRTDGRPGNRDDADPRAGPAGAPRRGAPHGLPRAVHRILRRVPGT